MSRAILSIVALVFLASAVNCAVVGFPGTNSIKLGEMPPPWCVGAADGIDLSNVPATTLEIPQKFNGNIQAYNWSINLCQPMNVTNCPSAGYVSELSMNTCEKSFTQAQSNWMVGNGSINVSFNSSDQWNIAIEISCDRSLADDSLALDGQYVIANQIGSGTYEFLMTLKSRAACPPCKKVSTSTGSIHLGQIAPQVLKLDQKFSGTVSVYDWGFNFCSKGGSAIVPSNAAPCTNRGFLEEYNMANGVCEASFDTLSEDWAWNGTAITASYTDSKGWTANVHVTCDKTASRGLNLVGSSYTASGTPSTGITFDFEFKSSAACPGNSKQQLQIMNYLSNTKCIGTANTTMTAALNTCLQEGPASQNISIILSKSPYGKFVVLNAKGPNCTATNNPQSTFFSPCGVCLTSPTPSFGNYMFQCSLEDQELTLSRMCNSDCSSCTKTGESLHTGVCGAVDDLWYEMESVSEAQLVTSDLFTNTAPGVCNGAPADTQYFPCNTCVNVNGLFSQYLNCNA